MWQKELKGSIPREEYHGSSALTDGGSNDGRRPEVRIFLRRRRTIVTPRIPNFLWTGAEFLFGNKNCCWPNSKSNSFRKTYISSLSAKFIRSLVQKWPMYLIVEKLICRDFSTCHKGAFWPNKNKLRPWCLMSLQAWPPSTWCMAPGLVWTQEIKGLRKKCMVFVWPLSYVSVLLLIIHPQVFPSQILLHHE